MDTKRRRGGGFQDGNEVQRGNRLTLMLVVFALYESKREDMLGLGRLREDGLMIAESLYKLAAQVNNRRFFLQSNACCLLKNGSAWCDSLY